jgi:hypothetical protein
VCKRYFAFVSEEGGKMNLSSGMRARARAGACMHATGSWNTRMVGPLRLLLSWEAILPTQAGGMRVGHGKRRNGSGVW